MRSLINEHQPYSSTRPGQQERQDPDYIQHQISNGPNPPHDYKEISIVSPFTNRKEISIHGKRKPGVYVFKDTKTGAIYVGGAVNLYNRVCSYFIERPKVASSIINGETRRVYRYFRNYGYDHLKLHLFIMSPGSTVSQIVELEQYFIDTLKPDLVAGGSEGTHTPMSQE